MRPVRIVAIPGVPGGVRVIDTKTGANLADDTAISAINVAIRPNDVVRATAELAMVELDLKGTLRYVHGGKEVARIVYADGSEWEA